MISTVVQFRINILRSKLSFIKILEANLDKKSAFGLFLDFTR